MSNIDNVIDLMKALKNIKAKKSVISTKINKLKEKRKIIIKELPTMEEELQFWQNELSEFKKKGDMDEDIDTWKDEIKKIQLKIDEVEKEVNDNKNELENAIKCEKKLNKELSNLSSDIQNYIFNILKDKNYINDYSKNDLIILTQILKEVLEAESKLEINSFVYLIDNERIKIPLAYLELINKVFNYKLTIIPEIIPKFISNYLNNFKSGRLLNPWPLNGFMLKTLSSETKNNDLITYNQNENKIFQTILHDLDIKLDIIDSDLKYDFIVGYPPIKNINELTKDFQDIKISDDYAIINFLNAALSLNETGEGIFILEKKFLLNRTPESVFSNLNKFGLHIKAIIEIPYFLMSENEEKLLVIINREVQKEVFIGSLSQDPKINKMLNDNLILKAKGKIPQYGHITLLDTFYTFKSLYAQIESLRMSNDLNLSTRSLSEIVEEINLPSKIAYIDKPNSLYIPIKETLKVEVDPDKTNKSDYIQVVLDQENSLAEYLAVYLNETVLGSKIRESINLGSYTESLFNSISNNTEFYIPDLDSQVEVLRVDSLINEIAARAASHRNQLWKKPNEYSKIIEDIELLDDNSEYQFERWVESLPYPLASILWESFSTSRQDLKVKYLLHFFEALSEFNVILMLSGLISDERFFNSEFYRCTQPNPKFKNWFYSPSFGNWNFFGQCLGRNIQYILRKLYKRNQLLEIFGNSEPEFLNTISSNELYEVLAEVNRYRNSWEAHGPVVSSQEYENRYKILRNSISKLYKCIGNIFENNLLVIPLESTFSEGIHHYTVKKFSGSRNRFMSIEVETIIPMDSNNIYLLIGNHRKPIELLPLIKFYKNACYFYNSTKKSEYKSQFVSYHNKEIPGILYPQEKLEHFYSIFESESSYKQY